MVVVGILLILVAAAATTFAVVATGAGHSTVHLSAFGASVSASPTTVFLSGAAALLLLVLGLALLRRGFARKARERRELKRLRKQQGSTTVTPSGTTSRAASPGDGTTTGSSTQP